MKLHGLACAVVLCVILGAGAAWAGSVTGTGSGPTVKDACDAAKTNATSQLPAGAKIQKFSQCQCRGQATKSCTVGADY